jgi:hypothetical protein
MFLSQSVALLQRSIEFGQKVSPVLMMPVSAVKLN